MRIKPDCVSLPWLAAALTIFGAGGRLLLPTQTTWLSYLFFGLVAALALVIAYFGWKCHIERQLPSPHLCKLLVHLAKNKGFSGTASQFNKEAQQVLYEQKFSQYIPEPTDYYSLLVANDHIKIVGVSCVGTTHAGIYIALTDKAKKLINSLC